MGVIWARGFPFFLCNNDRIADNYLGFTFFTFLYAV